MDIEGNKALRVNGNKCPKGEKYAISEIENPLRYLTSSVLARGLSLKMIPVRTDKPIPRNKLLQAMKATRKLRISKAVKIGDIIVQNFLGLKVNLITTRESFKKYNYNDSAADLPLIHPVEKAICRL